MVLAIATALLGRLSLAGALFLVVVALYSAGRLALQPLRESEPQRVAGDRFRTGRKACPTWPLAKEELNGK